MGYLLSIGGDITVRHKFLRIYVRQEPVERFAFQTIAECYAICQITDAGMFLENKIILYPTSIRWRDKTTMLNTFKSGRFMKNRSAYSSIQTRANRTVLMPCVSRLSGKLQQNSNHVTWATEFWPNTESLVLTHTDETLWKCARLLSME